MSRCWVCRQAVGAVSFLFFFVLRDDAESGVVAYTAEVRVHLFLFQSVVQMAQKVHFAWPSAIKRNKRVFVSRAPFTSLLCFFFFLWQSLPTFRMV